MANLETVNKMNPTMETQLQTELRKWREAMQRDEERIEREKHDARMARRADAERRSGDNASPQRRARGQL